MIAARTRRLEVDVDAEEEKKMATYGGSRNSLQLLEKKATATCVRESGRVSITCYYSPFAQLLRDLRAGATETPSGLSFPKMSDFAARPDSVSGASFDLLPSLFSIGGYIYIFFLFLFQLRCDPFFFPLIFSSPLWDPITD